MLQKLPARFPNGGPLGRFAFRCSEPLHFEHCAPVDFCRPESQEWTDWGRRPARLSVSTNSQIPSKELYHLSLPRQPESALVSPGLLCTAQEFPRLLLLQGSMTSTLSLLLCGEETEMRWQTETRGMGGGGNKINKKTKPNHSLPWMRLGAHRAALGQAEETPGLSPSWPPGCLGWLGAGLLPGREPPMESCKRV